VSPQPPAGGPPAAAAAKSGAGKVILWIVGIFAGLCVLGVIFVIAGVMFVTHKVKQAGFDPDLMKKNPVLAMTKMLVAGDPDSETVSSDDSSGTIVVRNKKTGKISTMKVDPDRKTMTITDENGKSVTMKLDPNNNRLVLTDDQGKTATITADPQAGNVEIKGPDGNFKMGTNAGKTPDWVPVYPGATPQNVFSASSNGVQTGTYGFVTKDPVDKVLAFYDSGLKSGGFKTSKTTTDTNGKVMGTVSGTVDSDQRTVLVVVGGEDDGTKVSVTFNSKP